MASQAPSGLLQAVPRLLMYGPYINSCGCGGQEPMASQAAATPPEPRYHLLTHVPAETLDFFIPAKADYYY